MGTKRKVGLIFSGGPAPAANAVISATAMAFRRNGWDCYGFLHGYESLADYRSDGDPLVEGRDYHLFDDRDLRGLRNARGIFIGTSRTDIGSGIRGPEDLQDAERSARLRNVHHALTGLGIEALVSIGGDGSLRLANLLHLFQRELPEGEPRLRIVHLPKTIDNDYEGIDFTFGFFTAVDVLAKALLNLRADAIATQSYFVVETMGRSAGWMAYAAAVAGEAHMVVAAEDLDASLCMDGVEPSPPSSEAALPFLDIDKLASRIADLVDVRARKGKPYGLVVLAEGLLERLPPRMLDSIRDAEGHLSLVQFDFAKTVAQATTRAIEARGGATKKMIPVQLGYESRCGAPHAFDVLLGCQLGLGAYRALVEEELSGHMVSVAGQLELHYVPFERLVDRNLTTEIRMVDAQSDFFRLVHFLMTSMREG